MTVLARLQLALETLHDVRVGACVTEFLVDDDVRDVLPGAKRGIPEQLFIHEDEEALDIALYLDPALVSQVESDPPSQRLHSGNFEPFCVVLEGVSHFVFVAYRTQLERPVSGLELEIQAEVDKFVVSWLLLAEQGVSLGSSAALLRRRLFQQFTLRDEVAVDERERYARANQYADSFCRSLSGSKSPEDVRTRVRGYFRSGLAEKARRFASAA
ncbi:MAG: hypothetical protein AAFQ82_00755 [Myxococcota bacterium]